MKKSRIVALDRDSGPRATVWAAAGRVIVFVVAWLVLNTLANIRQPARDVGPGVWFLLPSVDIVVVLGAFALAGWRGVPLPAPVPCLLSPPLPAARLFP